MSTRQNTSGKALSVPEGSTIIEQVVSRPNMKAAYKRVVSNKGAPGIDGLRTEELKSYLNKHWAVIKVKLLSGSYQPQAVRQVEIPKANGGVRQLGIPTVVDRLIQQAIHQILSPIFDPHFSAHSYGFRKGKNTHQAVVQARAYQAEGRRWVVDMDLEKFFDKVNHDVLISLIRRRMNDSKTLKLIRSYLNSGIMIGGLHSTRTEGTPQGSPLSPLLSNIMLDELDKELEDRGHQFVRYADDCNIYVNSRKAGDRVLDSISQWLEEKLRLPVNKDKSAVSRPSQRKFLGFTFIGRKPPLIRVPKEITQRLRKKLKQLFRMGRGRNLERFIKEDLNPVIRGWINYFRLAEVKAFAEELDMWIRRRLRLILWRQWKRPRARMQRLIKAGLPEEQAAHSAYNGRGAWWNSGAKHMNIAFRKAYFTKLGLVSMLEVLLKHQTS